MHFSNIIWLKSILIIVILVITSTFVKPQSYNDLDEIHDHLLFNNRYFLDSLSFKLGDYVPSINSKGNIYDVIQYIDDKPSIDLKVILQVNENYDTTSQCFIRTKTSDIIRILDYYGLDESRYDVEKIVDLESSENNIARRLISVEFIKNENKNIFFDTISCQLLIDNETEVNVKRNRPEYSILRKYYEESGSFKFNLLTIPLIYGGLYIDTIPEEWRVEMEISKDDMIVFVSNAERNTTIKNFSIKGRDNQIYLHNSDISIVKDWIGDDFKFTSDETTSLPINPVPVNKTKEKIECINNQFPNQWYVEYLGGCNGHVFWKFNWSLIDTNAPIAMYIDEEKQVGIISFLRENGRLGFNIYDYNSNNEVIYRGDNLLVDGNSFINSRSLIILLTSGFVLVLILIMKNSHNTAPPSTG